MEQKMVTIEAQAYEELVARSERLSCLERLLENEEYVSTGTMRAMVCVKRRGENEAV